MTFCDLCGEVIESWMHSDWYGNKFVCGPECAEAHGLKGDNDYDEPAIGSPEPCSGSKVA